MVLALDLLLEELLGPVHAVPRSLPGVCPWSCLLGCGHSHYAIQLVVTPARGSLELFELLLRLFGSSSTFVAPTTLLGLGSIAFLS
ncbi:hypothetical protein CDL15_Pgr016913 [Punica granatum]|uniref:Secreted protein n=1 Tax=Punica granatum TaxID=22663 RepID=A0A218WXC9_PUNGR|nr:hypothetical protein CDL15_Pgr016913 [Punica granatum]